MSPFGPSGLRLCVGDHSMSSPGTRGIFMLPLSTPPAHHGSRQLAPPRNLRAADLTGEYVLVDGFGLQPTNGVNSLIQPQTTRYSDNAIGAREAARPRPASPWGQEAAW